MTKTVEIILCSTCEGKGVTSNDELVDYHKREYVTHVNECRACNGSGRMKKITTVTFEPFVKPKTGTF